MENYEKVQAGGHLFSGSACYSARPPYATRLATADCDTQLTLLRLHQRGIGLAGKKYVSRAQRGAKP
jgi:hypothetical protein